MALLKFDDFIFDSTRYRLSHKGKTVALRPKALRLIHLLITNRQRVVSKDEIFVTVWGSTFVRDHLLFQLISELRKAPLKNEYVRTQPNHGYQWNVATRPVRYERPLPLPVAACFIVVTICASAALYLFAPSNPVTHSAQLPAHSAFSKGVVALEAGNQDQAIAWFQFAVNENPASVESSLFLAESLFQQNRIEESSTHVNRILRAPALDPYNKMIANDLLSRIYLQQGKPYDALHHARESIRANVVAQCSIEAVEQRFENLADKLGIVSSIQSTDPAQQAPDNVAADTLSQNYQDQCSQLNHSYDETSGCIPDKTGDYYVNGIQTRLSFAS